MVITLFISIFLFNLSAFLMKKKLPPYEYYSSIYHSYSHLYFLSKI